MPKVSVQYTKAFIRQYDDLSGQLKQKAKKCIRLFEENPKHPSLKTHALDGKLDGYYSFSVDYETRIVFEFIKDTAVFLKIGNHDVYR